MSRAILPPATVRCATARTKPRDKAAPPYVRWEHPGRVMTINQQRPRLDALIEAIAAPLRQGTPAVGRGGRLRARIAAGLEALAADIAPAPAIARRSSRAGWHASAPHPWLPPLSESGHWKRSRSNSRLSPASRCFRFRRRNRQSRSASPRLPEVPTAMNARPHRPSSARSADTVLTPGDERISHGLCESCFAGFVRAE